MVNKVFLTAFIVIVFDQLSKFIFKNYFNFITNSGAAFGILQGQRLIFILVSLFVIFLIFKFRNKYESYALGLILGGTIGNLIDRLFLGHVIDFIDLKFWPSFNVADTANTIGLIWLIWKYRKD